MRSPSMPLDEMPLSSLLASGSGRGHALAVRPVVKRSNLDAGSIAHEIDPTKEMLLRGEPSYISYSFDLRVAGFSSFFHHSRPS